MVDLSTEFAGLRWQNPLMSASGTFGHGTEMTGMVPFERLGAWVSKTVTWEPRPGNAMPRIYETEAGFLNSIGLENRGVEHYIEHVLPDVREARRHQPDTRVITNLGGHTAEEFARLAERLDDEECIDAFEVNLSCPNVDGGKLPYSTDPSRAAEVLEGVRKVTKKPLFAKISPNVTRVDEIARGCEAGGADGITAGNTLLGMGVDWRRRTPRLATGMGGYSGVGVKPVALRCAYQVAQAVSIPVIGCGGIQSAEDVMEYLVVGCQAVQVGTVSFSDPSVLARMGQDLVGLLQSEGIETLSECIGTLQVSSAKPWRKP
ncbi:MAG: dihydroorotate dehydrogenase (NAD+) catalytic subunit [Glaciecola sp.]|jgi:dihydroorotate dehydrogenase (NAD+) catalytic subunit